MKLEMCPQCGYAGVRIGEASNPGPNPGAGDSSASGSGAVEASSPMKLRTRRLEYVKYDEVSYSGDSLALHDSSAKGLRNAARQWAEQRFGCWHFQQPYSLQQLSGNALACAMSMKIATLPKGQDYL